MKKDLLFCAKLLTFTLCASCVSAPPQVSHCLTNSEKGHLQCVNSKGTEYNLPFEKADKYVCMSSKDYIDLITWFRQVMKQLEERAK